MRNFVMRNLFKRLKHSNYLLPLAGLALVISMLPLGCGGNEDQQTTTASRDAATGAQQGQSSTDPCSLAMPGDVAAVFGGAVVGQKPGVARNCTYDIEAGSVKQVNVYYYGEASEWDAIRLGYEYNRRPLTDVPGVGDKAFYPGDVGEFEIIVLSGDVVFAVGLGPELGPPDAAAKVKELAIRIAQNAG